MYWQSFGLARFDPSPLLQGHTGSSNFKCLIFHLLLLLQLKNGLPGYMEVCAGSLMNWSDLTSDPSFKVKLWSSIFQCLISRLLLLLKLKNVFPGYRKACAWSLMD